VVRRFVLSLVLLVALVACGASTYQTAPYDVSRWARHLATVDGFQLHYDVVSTPSGVEGGEGKPVLFLHGYSSFLNMWYPTAVGLGPGYRAILVDLPGHGLSDRREADYSPQGVAATLWKLMDQLGEGTIAVVGHSWGASVALAMALQRPGRVSKLALVDGWVYEEQNNTFMDWAQVHGVGEALYGAFYDQQAELRYMMAFAEPEKWVDQDVLDPMLRMMERFPGAKAAGLAVVRALGRLPEQEPRYRTVTQPALLVWCREDQVSLPHYGERLASELPGARYEVIPQCGHLAPIEQTPRFVLLLRSFL
jgi:pimeloyl-ACP methyl ester carboxylesterase